LAGAAGRRGFLKPLGSVRLGRVLIFQRDHLQPPGREVEPICP
jgi:hypothetical protein